MYEIDDEQVTNRAKLSATGTVTERGEFEVLAITAGEGNGWQFSESCLQESVELWEGAECFVDHAWWNRSIRDLGGMLQAAEWDESRKGVKCKLRVMGPSGALVAELGKQLVGEGKAPRVGFSADVVFTAQGRKVQKILRVNSVDLVFNPARGGAFLRALNSIQARGGFVMGDENTNQGGGTNSVGGTNSAGLQTQLQQDLNAVQTLLQVQEQQAQLAREAEQARVVRAAMCGHLLESGLSASRLPQPVAERIRKQFAGKVFEPAELTQAIDDAREMVSQLTGPGVVQGPGRIHGMFSSEDQFSAAVYDLLGAERPEGMAGLKAARLSGIRELYTLMTGDVEFVGGYNAERATFSKTADLPVVLKNAMNKLIVQEWAELGKSGYRWWEKIVSVVHFNSLQEITGILVGEVTVLPVVAEGDAYTALDVSDSGETGTWVKYGGYVGLTLEMFERDETHRMRQYPKKLAAAGLRRVSNLVSTVFTANAGVGPVMTDTLNVFEALTHKNLGTTALGSASWEAASAAIYNQDMLVKAGGTAPKLALDAKYLVVPRALRLSAMQLLYPSMERAANITAENMQKGDLGDVVTCPEFSDATDWAAVADPRLAPGIVVAERFGLTPEIVVADGAQQGALFTNDEIRMKARHWLAVFVADYRPLYKANVAG